MTSLAIAVAGCPFAICGCSGCLDVSFEPLGTEYLTLRQYFFRMALTHTKYIFFLDKRIGFICPVSSLI